MRQAPTAVTILGWSYLVIAALILVRSAGELSANYPVISVVLWGDSELYEALMSKMPERMKSWLLYKTISNTTQVVIMGAAVYASLFFLNLKEWARRALEYLTWSELVYQMGAKLYYVTHIENQLASLKDLPPGAGPPENMAIHLTLWAIGGLGAWFIFCYLMMRYLQSEAVKGAMR